MTKKECIKAYEAELVERVYELMNKAVTTASNYEELKELERALLTIADVGIDFFDELLDKSKPEEYEIAYCADIEESLQALDDGFKEFWR